MILYYYYFYYLKSFFGKFCFTLLMGSFLVFWYGFGMEVMLFGMVLF